MTACTKTTINDKEYTELMPFQTARLQSMAEEFIIFNRMAESHDIKFCPKCNTPDPGFTKGGTTKKGKQMLRCHSCGKRFVYDTGSLTYYSQQDAGKWSSFIKGTLEGKSLYDTSREINVSEKTAFRMRHKLMCFIEDTIPCSILGGQVEVDEKYFEETHKGLLSGKCTDALVDIFTLEGIRDTEDLSKSEESRVKGQIAALVNEVNGLIYMDEQENKAPRGLSHQQVCVITGIERGGVAEGHATNTARPSAENAGKFLECVDPGSHVWLDGCNAYPGKLQEKGCSYTVVTDENRNSVNHVNNINSLHSFLAERNRKARGVNSIYINRYMALWKYAYNNRGMDSTEMTMKLLGEFGKKQQYVYTRELFTRNIFDDPYVMEKRKGRKSVLTAYMLANHDPERRKDLYETIIDANNGPVNYSIVNAIEDRYEYLSLN